MDTRRLQVLLPMSARGQLQLPASYAFKYPPGTQTVAQSIMSWELFQRNIGVPIFINKIENQISLDKFENSLLI